MSITVLGVGGRKQERAAEGDHQLSITLGAGGWEGLRVFSVL